MATATASPTTASSVDVGAMYKSFGVLADADDATQHEKEYEVFLLGVKSDEKVKQLSAEFIQRYFAKFPQFAEQSLDALMDLCEEPNIAIRQKAIASLFKIAKDNTEQIVKVSDIITQFLQSEDDQERKHIETYLMQLLEIDTKACVQGMFSHVGVSDDDELGSQLLQQRVLEFFGSAKNRSAKLSGLMSQPDVVTLLLDKAARVFGDGKDDAELMIQFLQSLRYFNTVNGTLQIIELLAKAADLTQPVTLTAPPTARLQRLMLCTELALCMFSRTLNSNKFLLYFTTHVLPLIQVPSVPPPDTQTKQIDLCHLYAQLSTNVADLDSADDIMTAIVQKLLEFLPTPVDVDVEQSSAAAATAQHPTRLNFAYVECLLYALHSIGKRHESFFKESSATPEREALVRSLKRQLQYFTICKQAYVKKMEVAKSKKLKAGAGRVAEERKKFETVERMIANITQLIRDLFHTPPSYTASIKLSWKSKDGIASGVGVASAPAGGQKRARITFADSSSSNGAAATTAAVEAQTKWRKDDVGLGGRGFRGRGIGRGGGIRRF